MSYSYTTAGEGVGIDNLLSEPHFNFMSYFEEETEEDSVPDSFFINNNYSPYSNININCNYINVTNLNELKQGKLNILSLNIQSLPANILNFLNL